MWHTRLLILVMATLVLTACGGAMAPTSTGGVVAPAPAATAGPAPAAALEESRGDVAPGTAANDNLPNTSQRLVIKNAQVSLQVESVPSAEASIRARAEQLGGYVVSVQTSGRDERQTSTIVFRVPAARFEEALTGVEGLARKMLSRNVSGDDVTEEYVDLQSRLRNLEATRDRLLDLLARATKVEDALQVNAALTDVQGEIEQIQGRIKYLQQSAALSTITAELQPVPPPPAIIQEDQWQPLRVAGEALRGLVEFGQGLANLAIVLAIWTPVWLPLALLGRWGWRRMRGGRRAAATPPPPSPPVGPGVPSA